MRSSPHRKLFLPYPIFPFLRVYVQPMRVLLRNLKTGLLLKSPGNWTHKASEALNFDSSRDAHSYRHRKRCLHTSVILRFRNPRHDVELVQP
jgi:hypothetical protein